LAKILLIEDDPNAREMLRFRLEKAGYTLSEAVDGDEGLLKSLRRPDLILLDIRIPKIDGWQLCKMIKSDPRTRDLPVVMLTGCSQPIQEEYGRQCGADAYLTKPWDPNELLKLAQRLIKRKG